MVLGVACVLAVVCISMCIPNLTEAGHHPVPGRQGDAGRRCWGVACGVVQRCVLACARPTRPSWPLVLCPGAKETHVGKVAVQYGTVTRLDLGCTRWSKGAAGCAFRWHQ